MDNFIMQGLLNAKPFEPHKVSILWGENPEDGDAAVTYKFKTEAELNAFMLGVNEASGWGGLEIVKEGHVHREEKMFSYTYTKDQARAIVRQWNALADEYHQLEWSDCHQIFGDNFDDELSENGEALIEIAARASKSGRPATFYVYESDLTKEEI